MNKQIAIFSDFFSETSFNLRKYNKKFLEIEKEIGWEIPKDIKRFLFYYNGFDLEEDYYFKSAEIIPTYTSKRGFFRIDRFLNFKDIKNSIDYAFNREQRIQGKKLLPIGDDVFGNFLCIGLNHNGYEILFFDHEELTPFYKISDSISEMLRSVTEIETPEISESELGIVNASFSNELLQQLENFKRNKKM